MGLESEDGAQVVSADADTSGAYRRHECPRCAELEAKAVGEEQDRRTLERWARLANDRADRAAKDREMAFRHLSWLALVFGGAMLSAYSTLVAAGFHRALSAAVALLVVTIAVAIGTRGAP